MSALLHHDKKGKPSIAKVFRQCPRDATLGCIDRVCHLTEQVQPFNTQNDDLNES